MGIAKSLKRWNLDADAQVEWRMFGTRLFAGALVLAVGACTLGPQPKPTDLVARCEFYLRTLDDTVASHQAGDAGAWRLPGFPHLRSTRFLAAFGDRVLDDDQTRDWVTRLHAVDAEARAVELANLPSGTRDELRMHSPFSTGHPESIARCGAVLIEHDLTDPERLASIRVRSQVPDHYRNWQRVVELYPLTQLFVRPAIGSLHKELSAEFALPLDELPVRGPLQSYTPASPPSLSAGQVAEILHHAQDNPLAIPEPEPADLARLFNYLAPIWEFEQVSDDDHIGRVRYDDAAQAHYVDIREPVTYRWTSHTLFHEQALLQLNYLVWVPARSAKSSRDIYAGSFDGLIWRVTLLPDGTPLAFDSVHPCGCYYLLFTGAQAAPRETSNVEEPVLVAQQLALLTQNQRWVIRVRAGDHYIKRIYADDATKGIVYDFADYPQLLTIPDANGHAHSMFNEQGLVRASARTERYLLWPFGIASAGAMRRTGTQAIAFVGVRHFDDADLLQELVELRR